MNEYDTSSNKDIGQVVWLYFYAAGKIGPCTVSKVTYTDYGKVLYSLKLRPFINEIDNETIITEIPDIDSYFVKSEAQMILEGL